MAEALRPLIEAAQHGDRKALNELAGCADRFVRIFSGSLSRHLRKTQGSTVDFVLEGLAGALADLDTFEYRSDEEFYSMISRTIRSRMADAWRREARQKRAGRPAPLGEGDLQPPGSEPTPSAIVSQNELHLEIGNAIVELQVGHPREMEVVTLKVFDGESWSGIRALLQLSSDRVGRTLFARGLELLRPRLKKVLGDGALDQILGD
jgi:RNA polymerase sigma factor (sigma-70 family)